MKRWLSFTFVLWAALPSVALSAAAERGDRARLVVGIPAYVGHPDERANGTSWNEGWFHNEGALADISWPAYRLGEATRLRLGATAGAFDNSEFRVSVFLGGMAEIEHYVAPDVALSAGSYVGAVTGYDHPVVPGLAPYLGASYAFNETLEAGLRGFWLPGKTLGGASADSDAYVGAITLGLRF